MKQLIAEQVQFILLMTAAGMGIMFLYDILRLFRWLFLHASLFVLIEDLLFWVSMSVPVFYLFMLYHDGVIRWYGALSVFGGIIIYEWGLSRPLRMLMGRIFNPWRARISKKVHKIRGQIMVKLKQMSIRCQKKIAKNRDRVYNKQTSLHG